LLALVLLAASSLAVVVTGGLAERAGKLLGLGSTAVTVWDIAKWSVLVLIAALLFALLYYATPNVRHPGFRAIVSGGIAAVLLWIVASALLALYVAKFGSYYNTYGSLGAVVVFLVWLWISNLAILFGAELNAESPADARSPPERQMTASRTSPHAPSRSAPDVPRPQRP
jgi:membrane protein